MNWTLSLAIIAVVLINIGILTLIKKVERKNSTYETMFCRDVRAQLGMFVCKSDVEYMRKRVNRRKSKF